jgi:type I restriction enzyme S subunit
VRLHLKSVTAREYRGTESEESTLFLKRRAGQFIYGKQNIFRGAIGLIPDELDGYASTQDIPAFDIDDEIDPEWLLLFLSRPNFYKRLESYASGSGSKRLQPKELYKITIKVPPLFQQEFISNALNAARREIDLRTKQLEAYRKQKQGLVRRLLNGEWRTTTDRKWKDGV